jgi:UDP-N-acetylglucosamine--N-acetylmuramyl-(pentapeptide) pyrophosphoryl-undecaprenol N-acetylglucosamine transferase
MTRQEKVALIMAGGTGGHVFPALAVAEALRDKGVTVHWLGTRSGIESRVVPQAGFDISYISIKGLRGNGLVRWVLAPFRIGLAVLQALKICLNVRPNFVLGMGGFVTGPGGVASKLAARPLLIHEQNAIPGLTNRLLSKFATRVMQAFPKTFRQGESVYYTGNPVRKSILDIEPPNVRYLTRSSDIRILIVGGSLGAQALNEVVPEAMAILSPDYQIDIWHQAGKGKAESAVASYKDKNINARVVEFIDDMDAAYQWADIIICRAGAMTVAEISNVGIASLLVPYPFAVDDHQTANARFLSNQDAALLIQQSELTPSRLADELKTLINLGREHLLEMANRALKLGRRDATEVVVRHCMEAAL